MFLKESISPRSLSSVDVERLEGVELTEADRAAEEAGVDGDVEEEVLVLDVAEDATDETETFALLLLCESLELERTDVEDEDDEEEAGSKADEEDEEDEVELVAS